MAGHDMIVLGASTGGVETLTQLVRGLPPGFPATLFVVCHFPPGGTSVLPEILSRAGPLLASHPRDGAPTYPGHIYVAPPDHHMVLQPGQVQLTRGARENGFRPAIDVLFRSAARVYGRRVIGVVLTGGLYDGVAGLLAVRAAGGLAVIQEPADSLVAALPQHARDIAGADYLVSAAGLAALLAELVQRPVGNGGDVTMKDPLEKMTAVVDQDMEAQARGDRRGRMSVFICPECGGSLWQVDEKELLRFRCHVGHAYNGEVLLAEQAEALEAALWTAVRTFREKGVLARQLAAQERQAGKTGRADWLEEQARIDDKYGEVIRDFLSQRAPEPAEVK
jgi:two-component system, chemotaxis family, protein-glutamate methylesterase/glutaminase